MLFLLEELGETERFLQLMKKDLVNSNVLLRSILLTDYQLRNSFSGLKNKLPVLFDNSLIKGIKAALFDISIGLINAVASQQLSSESITIFKSDICCINTFFIIYLFFESNGQFEENIRNLYVSLVKSGKLKQLNTTINSWDYYYTLRTKEIFRLEFSTDIRINNLFNIKNKIRRKRKKYINYSIRTGNF